MENEPAIKRRPGRPVVNFVDPVIKAQLIEYIRAGNYIQTACNALGISDDFYYRIQEYADQGRTQFIELLRDLKKAEADAEIMLTGRMLLGGANFLPSATMLERRFRDRYGRSDRHQIDATVSIRVEQVDYTKLAKQVRTHKVK
jgi:hypothetical protein